MKTQQTHFILLVETFYNGHNVSIIRNAPKKVYTYPDEPTTIYSTHFPFVGTTEEDVFAWAASKGFTSPIPVNETEDWKNYEVKFSRA